ncbi:hypothetical protein [Streptomyces kanamyceticus]|uniref:hypothetical protein n=1 Tax=Streptomyces kanamyceticus TaxID=1967 RepID=UPI0012FEEF33|nr:hypothetical protein [Streptomyces kanamyceticus]
MAEHHAEGVEVGGEGDRRSGELLGREEAPGAHDVIGTGDGGAVEGFGDADGQGLDGLGGQGAVQRRAGNVLGDQPGRVTLSVGGDHGGGGEPADLARGDDLAGESSTELGIGGQLPLDDLDGDRAPAGSPAEMDRALPQRLVHGRDITGRLRLLFR